MYRGVYLKKEPNKYFAFDNISFVFCIGWVKGRYEMKKKIRGSTEKRELDIHSQPATDFVIFPCWTTFTYLFGWFSAFFIG